MSKFPTYGYIINKSDYDLVLVYLKCNHGHMTKMPSNTLLPNQATKFSIHDNEAFYGSEGDMKYEVLIGKKEEDNPSIRFSCLDGFKKENIVNVVCDNDSKIKIRIKGGHSEEEMNENSWGKVPEKGHPLYVKMEVANA